LIPIHTKTFFGRGTWVEALDAEEEELDGEGRKDIVKSSLVMEVFWSGVQLCCLVLCCDVI
jgi:hypothetical protein